MAQVLIRDLDDEMVTALKEQAKQHHRSLQGEVKAILERHLSRSDNTMLRSRMEQFRTGFGGRMLPDSAEIIRQSRDER